MQVDIALQYDRTCEPYALWHNEFTATFLGERIDSLGKGCGTERRTVANSTKVLEVYLIGWELWTGHLSIWNGRFSYRASYFLMSVAWALSASKQAQTMLKFLHDCNYVLFVL